MTVRVVLCSGGVKLHVEEVGEGPAILMLHAGVSERHMWDRQWEWLQHGFRLVRWDWRGYGETPHVPGAFSYLDDVLRVMDAAHLDRTTIMAASFAGGVALRLAIEHPERVDRLVLVAPGVPGYAFSNPPAIETLLSEADQAVQRHDMPRALTLLERLWLIGPQRSQDTVSPGYLGRARALLAAADQPDEGARLAPEDREWSAQGRITEINVPVLVITGDQDLPEVHDAARVLAEQLPHLTWEMLEDAAHLPNMERGRQFDAVLSDWLAETRGGEERAL